MPLTPSLEACVREVVKGQDKNKRRIALVMLLILLLSDLVLSLSPPEWVSFGEYDKIAHLMGYATLTVLSLVIVPPSAWKRVILAFVGLAVFLEWLQVFVPRTHASLLDAVASIGGVLMGAVFLSCWRRLSAILGRRAKKSLWKSAFASFRKITPQELVSIAVASGGIGINQFLHTFAYVHTGTLYLYGFPNITISISVSYLLAVTLGGSVFVLLVWFFPKFLENPTRVLGLSFLITGIGQVCGRGLIKGVFDWMTMAIFYVYLLIIKAYGKDKWTGSKEVLSMMHDELLTLLDISVSVFTFIWGAMGVGFALDFLRKYYIHQELRYYAMVWYGVMVIYLGLQFLLFVTYTFYRFMIRVRRAFSKLSTPGVVH